MKVSRGEKARMWVWRKRTALLAGAVAGQFVSIVQIARGADEPWQYAVAMIAFTAVALMLAGWGDE